MRRDYLTGSSAFVEKVAMEPVSRMGTILVSALFISIGQGNSGHPAEVGAARAAQKRQGESPEELKAVIGCVLDGIKKNESALRNVWVTGTFLRGEGQGAPQKQVDSRLLKSYKFMYVVRGRDRRYEEEVSQLIGGLEEKCTGFIIMNAKGIYRLTRKQASILPLSDRQWIGQTWSFSQFQLAYGMGKYFPVTEFLALCLAQVRETDGKNKEPTVMCSLADSLITITALPARRKEFSMIEVDSAKAFMPVHLGHVLGDAGGPVFDHVECHIEYQQIAPSVFYPKKARRDIRVKGIASGNGWRHDELHVKDVKIGNFDCDASLFDPGKLPIPKDADILDYRTGELVIRPASEWHESILHGP